MEWNRLIPITTNPPIKQYTMITFNTGVAELLMVDWPSEYHIDKFYLRPNPINGLNLVIGYNESGGPSYPIDGRIPHGYTLIGLASEVSEEAARGLVAYSDWHFPVKHIRYVDYLSPRDKDNKQAWSVGFANPTESLLSILSLHHLNPETTCLLIKQS